MNDYYNESNLYNICRGIKQKPKKEQAKQAERSSYLKNFQQKNKMEREQVQMILNQTDHGMENILNSSLCQLDKVIQGMEEPERKSTVSVQEILKQNSVLKSNLIKMKKILKEKLEQGLSKQREELSKILEDYISLITKLLQDKEELTNRLSEREKENQFKEESEIVQKYQMLKETNTKLRKALDERDAQLNNSKQKINQFLNIIQEYEEEADKEQKKFDQMTERIKQLQNQLARQSKSEHSFGYGGYTNQSKYEAQQQKIQTLLQLLQNSQQQTYKANNDLSNAHKMREEMKAQYEKRIAEIQLENQEEFIEYENAVKQTINKKDQCIARLNLIINNVRNKNT